GSSSCRLQLQPAQLGQQLWFGFRVLRIGIDAFHRADHRALRLVEVADAFGAAGGIDDVDLLALADRMVRARGLADVAVDAEFVDPERHALNAPRAPGGRRARRSCLLTSSKCR